MMLEAAIAASILGLLAGPLVVVLGGRFAPGQDLIRGATSGLVSVVVATRLVPHLFGEIGVVAPLLAAIGYAAFALLERRRGHADAIGAAVVGPTLAVHSLLDGAGLALAFTDRAAAAGSLALGGALIAHRLPEGLFVASRWVPRVGLRATLGRIALLGAATLVGALSGHGLIARLPLAPLHGLVAFGSGIMLHLVVHRAHGEEPPRAWTTALGFALGAGCAALV
jgi:hypothetical protein